MIFKTGDHVIIEMNMRELKANIIFYSPTAQDAVVSFEEKKSFMIYLPDEVAIIIDAGLKVQEVRAVEQTFEYCK